MLVALTYKSSADKFIPHYGRLHSSVLSAHLKNSLLILGLAIGHSVD